jgi:3-methyl-2-oxobutanoate hydroxymethyltransferase
MADRIAPGDRSHRLPARISIRDLQAMKRHREPIVMLTAYDYPTARAVDAAGVPVILVGDSLGTAVLGLETTVGVTLDDMLAHTRAVVRGTRRALIVADLPFMTYQPSIEMALRSAAVLMQGGGAGAVKLEGGQPVVETVRRIVDAGIPVMGHLGLTPQSVHRLGGYRVQGRSAAAAQRLLDDALALQQAGAFAVVLELIPGWLAARVTEQLHVPTIGIGAGPACSGQVQVLADLLGLDPEFTPRHAQRYAELGEAMRSAIATYAQDVRTGTFPAASHYTQGSPAAGPAEAGKEPDGSGSDDP